MTKLFISDKTQIFLNKLKTKRKDKGLFYDYSLVDYKNSISKLEIICPIHGRFGQCASSHLRGFGCLECGYDSNRDNVKSFIKKANKIHKNKYDYSLVKYKAADKKVKIVCPIHGIFAQMPQSHTRGKGCAKCGYDSNRDNVKSFIKNAKRIHGNKYDYSLVKYKTARIKVKIICPIHGIFSQVPFSHSRGRGCPKCSDNKHSKPEFEIIEFIKSLVNTKIIHGDRTILKPKEIDIYLPEYNFAIEFNGIYWHSDKNKQKALKMGNRSLWKYNECKRQNIDLLHIWEDKYNEDKEYYLGIIRDKILNDKYNIEYSKLKETKFKDRFLFKV